MRPSLLVAAACIVLALPALAVEPLVPAPPAAPLSAQSCAIVHALVFDGMLRGVARAASIPLFFTGDRRVA